MATGGVNIDSIPKYNTNRCAAMGFRPNSTNGGAAKEASSKYTPTVGSPIPMTIQTTAVTINRSKRLDFPNCTKKKPSPNDKPDRATKPIIIPAIAQISIISTAAFPAETNDLRNNLRSSLEPSYLKNNEIMIKDKTAIRAAVSGRKCKLKSATRIRANGINTNQPRFITVDKLGIICSGTLSICLRPASRSANKNRLM